MRIHVRRLAFAACAVLATSVVSAQEGLIEEAARKAKQEGKTSLVIPFDGEIDYEEASHELARHSILIAVPRVLNVSTNVGYSTISSWHGFEVIEVLHKPDRRDDWVCDWAPPSSVPAKNLMAVLFLGGIATVQGVQVRVVHPGWPVPRIGERYVLFATICDDGFARFSHGRNDIYELTTDGVLGAPSAVLPAEYRTLARLRASLSGAK